MFRMYFIVFVAPNIIMKSMFIHQNYYYSFINFSNWCYWSWILNLPSNFGGNHFVDTWLSQLNSKHIPYGSYNRICFNGIINIVAATGIMAAYSKYANFDLSKPENETGFIGNKFYIDEIYDSIFVQPTKKATINIYR